MVVVSADNSLCVAVKVEVLAILLIWSSDHKFIVLDINISPFLHVGRNVEIHVASEAPIPIPITCFKMFEITYEFNVPQLALSVLALPGGYDSGVLPIVTSLDIDDLASLIYDVAILVAP